MSAPPVARRPIGLPVAGVQASEAMPRFIVPIEHFALAFVWLAVAMVGLSRVAPALAIGAYSTPGVVAVTHAMTLGLVLTSIVGALQQLAPVVMGVPARRESLAHVSFALIGVGTLGVVTAAWRWSPPLLGAGWSAIALAVLITWWNLVRHLRGAPRAPETARAVRAGFACLAAGLAVAFARIGNALGWWSVSQHTLLVAHVHLLLGGFATVVAMGMGGHVLPMFLMSRDVPTGLAWLAWRATFAGAVGVAVGALCGVFALQVTGAVVMAVGVGAWLGFVWFCVAHRSRRELDRSLFLIISAHLLLGAACLTGLARLFAAGARWETAYVALALFGWLGLFVSGVAARVIPMLTWTHRYAPRAGVREQRPTVAQLVPRQIARMGVAALVLGAVALPAAIVIGRESGVLASAFVNMAAVALLLLQHAWLAAPHRAPAGKPTSGSPPSSKGPHVDQR